MVCPVILDNGMKGFMGGRKGVGIKQKNKKKILIGF